MRKISWILMLLSLVLVSAGAGIYLLKTHQVAPQAPVQPAQPSATAKDSGTPDLSVNALAANPSAYLGTVQLTGVVATVESGNRFVLIDQSEYQACGIGCLGEAGTNKISVRWPGKAPAVEQTVQVTGDLAHTAKGYTFTARKVGTR